MFINNVIIKSLTMDVNNYRRQQGEKPYANTTDNQRYRTLAGEQPSDMLKFVRKIDSDSSNKISPDQVRFYFNQTSVELFHL